MARKYVYWAELPLRSESLRISQLTNPMYKDALKKDYTNEFHRELKIIARSQLNLILAWFGLQGYGKSFAMLDVIEDFLSYKPEPMKLTLDDVAFTITDMLKLIEKSERGDNRVLDEQIHNTGYGSNIEKQALKNAEMTVRAQKLSFFFAAPVFIPHNFHYFFEVWQMGSVKPWDWEVSIEEQWVYTKNIVYDQRGNMLGYVITNTPSDKDFLEKYEKKKSKFIDNVKKQRSGQRHKVILDKAYELAEHDEFIKKFSLAKTKSLKFLLTKVELKGFMMSIDETKQLIDYIDYVLAFEPKFTAKLTKFKKNIKKK